MARRLLSLQSVLAKLARIIKTGLGGLAAALVDFAALIALVEGVGVAVGPAAFAAAAIGAMVGFTIAKLWAFEDRRPVAPRQVAAYAAVALGNALLVAAGVHVLAVGMSLAYPIAKGMASAGAFAVWSYPAQSRWVFA